MGKKVGTASYSAHTLCDAPRASVAKGDAEGLRDAGQSASSEGEEAEMARRWSTGAAARSLMKDFEFDNVYFLFNLHVPLCALRKAFRDCSAAM